MVDAALQAPGGVGILVSNTGLHEAQRRADTSAEDFGRIIQACTAGKWRPRNQRARNASKHAVIGLTRCVAVGLNEHLSYEATRRRP